MRIKNNDYIQDIIGGHIIYEYKRGIIFFEGKPLLAKDYVNHFGKRITNLTTNAVKDLVSIIKESCAVEEDFNLWELFKEDQKERFKNYKMTKTVPMLFNLYGLKIKEHLINIAACLTQGKNRHMFVLHGVSGAGKSLFIDSMIALFGKTYQTVKQMTDFNGQFTLDGIQNKLLVQCNDLGQEQVTARASGRFKQICDGSEVNIERKSRKEELVKPWFNMLFGCNVLPQFNVLDAGNLSRGAYLYFPKKITIQNYQEFRAELLSEQELANLWYFCMNEKVNEKLLEELNLEWRQAQLSRHYSVIPSKHTTYMQYLANCDKMNIQGLNAFDFEELKNIMFGVDLATNVANTPIVEDEELPF